jgi:ubiquinone/menaquinone biosynthesis C-methylase UbiE
VHKTANNSESALTAGRTLDHAAWIYDVLSPPMTFYQEKRIGKRIVELLALGGSEKILDVGCGTGTLTLDLGEQIKREQGGIVIGIDAASKMIQKAKSKIKNEGAVQFETAAAENLPYGDEYFDCAVSTFFYHHINFELKVKSLNELWRVLKQGGRVVIADVDVPTNLWGKICAWSGYVLFQQNEIRENIEGRFREAMNVSRFGDYKIISKHLGYVTIFELRKEK